MKKPQLSDFRSQKTHITIEEAEKQGLWQIVRQLKTDKSTRESLGLKPLQIAITTPNKNNKT
jgi:hypothetical protein